MIDIPTVIGPFSVGMTVTIPDLFELVPDAKCHRLGRQRLSGFH